jgi:hypothetical protein
VAAPTSSPLVTVVLCRRDRAGALRLSLESLCRQTLPPDAFEVVVVDDGSTDGTREVVREFEPRLPVRYSHQRPAGVATARNHGLFLARGILVLFLDDDLADAALLERHVAAHQRFPEPWYAVLGATRLDPSIATDPLMRFMSEGGWAPLASPRLPAGEPLDPRWFLAGRSSCKRGFLVQKGTFNAAFRHAGEGLELGRRLAQHGFGVVHAPDAVTAVARPLDLDHACLAQSREGEASALFHRLHPAAAAADGLDPGHAVERWRRIAPMGDLVVRSARELDRLVRVREAERLPIDELERALLYRSYSAALAASRAKGIAEGGEPRRGA